MKKIRINKKYVWNPAKAAANLRRLGAAASANFACFAAFIVLLAAGLYMALLAVAALL